MASRKLRHYFQECSITVASEVPLNDIINNRDPTDRIAKWDIELNPKKCAFGVPAGKLLGFIVSGRGIEANPAKIQALSQLDIPKDLNKYKN